MPVHQQPKQNYVVKQGDTLSKLACEKGLASWRVIADDANNSTLSKDRPDGNLLYAGDQIWIPPLEVKEAEKATGAVHPFVIKETKLKLQLKLLDGDHKPHKNIKCQIKIDGTDVPEKTTDGDGKLEIPDVPATASVATLSYLGRTVELKIGWLDPLEETSGVAGRLKNLGYIDSDLENRLDGTIATTDPELVEGLKKFQSQYRSSKADGVLDAETRSKLKEVYGC